MAIGDQISMHRSVIGTICGVCMMATGCTNTTTDKYFASSTHKNETSTKIAQVQPHQQEPLLLTPDATQTNPTHSQDTPASMMQTLPKVQDPTIATNHQYSNAATTRSLAQPEHSIAPKFASLYGRVPNDDPSESQIRPLIQPQIQPQIHDAVLTPEQEAELLASERVNITYAQMSHATCKDGWATPPDRLDAMRMVPEHPYYMEMRMRHTPLLPVGHTYIAYGRLSPEGKPLDENVIMLSPIGGYGGAAFAAALPMPGILKPVADDCRIKPLAAYRVSLSALDFEKLLMRIQKAQNKIPAYALFAYNCNHFASDIVASVGILPPKNKYLPALKYIYGVIEANEGTVANPVSPG